MEALQPKNTFNPVIQHIYQCLHHRAMNPDAPIPPLDDMIGAYVRTPEVLSANAEAETAALRDLFPVVARADPRKRGTAARLWGQAEGAEEEEEERKRARLAQQDASGDITVASLLRAEVSAVGSVTPVEDYIALVGRRTEDLLVPASEQLIKRIEDLVDVYIGGPLGPFVAMVDVLRRHLVRDEPALFNTFLQRLVVTLRTQQALRQPFLDALIGNSLSLITTTENSASPYTPADAAAFLAAPAPAPAPVAAPPTDAAEDLLDEL